MSKTHGLTGSPEYYTWKHMKYRCKNPRDKSFYNYGARGITICKSWDNSFEAFIKDMGFKPTPKHTIERINNDGNYEPDNCCWATRLQQGHNTRKNKNITFNGKTLCQAEWARQLGVSHGFVHKALSIVHKASSIFTEEES